MSASQGGIALIYNGGTVPMRGAGMGVNQISKKIKNVAQATGAVLGVGLKVAKLAGGRKHKQRRHRR
jgi:hypothetical protein